jgi:hypothetical protein
MDLRDLIHAEAFYLDMEVLTKIKLVWHMVEDVMVGAYVKSL